MYNVRRVLRIALACGAESSVLVSTHAEAVLLGACPHTPTDELACPTVDLESARTPAFPTSHDMAQLARFDGISDAGAGPLVPCSPVYSDAPSTASPGSTPSPTVVPMNGTLSAFERLFACVAVAVEAETPDGKAQMCAPLCAAFAADRSSAARRTA